MLGEIHMGTCSWTDPTMVRAWYPAGVRSAEDRLRYYAARFDTVEVDSTFYGLPTPGTSRLWAERTPRGVHVPHQGLRHADPARSEAAAAPGAGARRVRVGARPPRPHPSPAGGASRGGLLALLRGSPTAEGRTASWASSSSSSRPISWPTRRIETISPRARVCCSRTSWRWSSDTPPGWSRMN